ncbi:unnamed protein product [Plutella xylostella]|uniref:(diamondback moth) hypothetical protein n=1 Tax=Plutella xylostella TaxID=51655 RepID=A0A8S4FYE9_PLUXY|nr:unnamed protein product [Plutella xylostella]
MKLKVNDKVTESPELVSNCFNKYFMSVGEAPSPAAAAAAAGSPTPPRAPAPPPPRAASSSLHSMFLHPVTETEILKIINSLGNKNTSGDDEIPSTLLKSCADILKYPLTRLINQSFKEGIFPEKLKMAKIIPIPKNKRRKDTDPDKFRPIALLSVISKIYEKAMTNKLTTFLEKNNLLHKNQHGFRKRHSTTLAVYKYMQEIYNYLNEKKYAIGLLLDLSKAYDKVSHKILLSKLYDSGVRGIAHDWFRSYLENRQQYVQIQHTDLHAQQIAKIFK